MPKNAKQPLLVLFGFMCCSLYLGNMEEDNNLGKTIPQFQKRTTRTLRYGGPLFSFPVWRRQLYT